MILKDGRNIRGLGPLRPPWATTAVGVLLRPFSVGKSKSTIHAEVWHS